MTHFHSLFQTCKSSLCFIYIYKKDIITDININHTFLLEPINVWSINLSLYYIFFFLRFYKYFSYNILLIIHIFFNNIKCIDIKY